MLPAGAFAGWDLHPLESAAFSRRTQGAVISPLLANVYLHYVYDLWVRQWRQRQSTGDMIVGRYADDTIVGFERQDDAERFLEDLSARMADFGLGLHPVRLPWVHALLRDPTKGRRLRAGKDASSQADAGDAAAGKIVVKRRLRRAEVVAFFRGQDPCLVGMEACATAHRWARELIALGHEVRLMPPAYVKAYVKRNKNDAADAAAICEAVTRPSMRFVPVKDVDQQAVLMMHRARNLLVRQRTMAVNALRAHLAEFGVVAPQGLRHVERLVAAIEENKAGLPELARSILRLIVAQLDDTQAKVRQIEAKLAQWHRNSRLSRLLETVPGVGILGASAIAATVSDPSLFRSGREFAAWLGMTPRRAGHMTAPDQIAKTILEPLAGGGRPHMIFA